jgi:hypothetical protein
MNQKSWIVTSAISKDRDMWAHNRVSVANRVCKARPVLAWNVRQSRIRNTMVVMEVDLDTMAVAEADIMAAVEADTMVAVEADIMAAVASM